MSDNKRWYFSQEETQCLPGALATVSPTFALYHYVFPFIIFKGSWWDNTLWRTKNSFHIARTKDDIYHWVIRQLDLQCCSDDSFVEPHCIPPQGQTKVAMHAFDYMAWLKNQSSWFGSQKAFDWWGLDYSSVARTEMSSQWSAFRWKQIWQPVKWSLGSREKSIRTSVETTTLSTDTYKWLYINPHKTGTVTMLFRTIQAVFY